MDRAKEVSEGSTVLFICSFHSLPFLSFAFLFALN